MPWFLPCVPHWLCFWKTQLRWECGNSSPAEKGTMGPMCSCPPRWEVHCTPSPCMGASCRPVGWIQSKCGPLSTGCCPRSQPHQARKQKLLCPPFPAASLITEAGGENPSPSWLTPRPRPIPEPARSHVRSHLTWSLPCVALGPTLPTQKNRLPEKDVESRVSEPGRGLAPRTAGAARDRGKLRVRCRVQAAEPQCSGISVPVSIKKRGWGAQCDGHSQGHWSRRCGACAFAAILEHPILPWVNKMKAAVTLPSIRVLSVALTRKRSQE